MSDKPRKDHPRQRDSLGRPDWDSQAESAARDVFAADEFLSGVTEDADRESSFGRSLRRQLLSVPTPEGFRERLLAAVMQKAEADFPAQAISADGELARGDRAVLAAAVGTAGNVREDWSRRRWLRWTAAALAGGTAAAVILHFTRRGPVIPPLDAGELMQSAGTLFESQEQAFGTGVPLAERPPAEPYRLSRDVRGRDIRWRSVVLLQRSAVAFDMRSPAGDAATLFALAETIPGLPQTPPSRPLLRTSRTAVAAWHDAPLTYVLVVEGDAAAYRRFLAPLGPVA